MQSPLELEVRTCGCGCGLTFRTSHRSSKFYYNPRHQKKAKEQRRKGQPTQRQPRFVASAEAFDAVGKLLPPGFSHEVVLSLIATTKDVQHPSGTAVLISPHCALTARHVIEDYLKLKASPDARLAITGRSGFVKEHENTDWRFNQVILDPNSDMALLVLSAEEPPIAGLRYPTIYIPPPEKGDEIIAAGFPSSTIEPSVDKDEPVSRWHDLPTISWGRVFEVHHQKRDGVLANFPCFMTDCKVDGGMSGGPVFDRNGFLRGIISRGITLHDNKQHTTTVQSIWTSLLLPTINSPLLITKGYGNSLYEAAQLGKIATIGLERLEPRFREDGTLENLSLRRLPVAPHEDEATIPLSELWKNVTDAINEGLARQHGTHEDGTPKYQSQFVESEEINASAVNYSGVAVITVTTTLRDLVWAMCHHLSHDAKIGARFGIPTKALGQALHVELFNTVIGIVVVHEYGHHVLNHCVQQCPDIPLHSDIVNSYRGNIEYQAREVQADGYAVYLILYGLLIGERRDTVAQSIAGITDQGRLSLFIISAATFFFLREPAAFDAARIEELTHPPAAIRLNALMHHVERYLTESKPDLLPVLTLPLFQELVRNVKEVLWASEGPAWPDEDQFGRSPAGLAYIKKLYKAYDALQEANQAKQSTESQSESF